MIADIIGNNASLMLSAASPWHYIHFTQRALYIFAPGITKDGTRGDPVDGLKTRVSWGLSPPNSFLCAVALRYRTGLEEMAHVRLALAALLEEALEHLHTSLSPATYSQSLLPTGSGSFP